MSADYKLAQPVNFKKLLKYAPSIRETFDEDCTADDIKIITDGTNYLHVYLNKRGQIDSCTRYGGNNEDANFDKIYEETDGTPLEGMWNASYAG